MDIVEQLRKSANTIYKQDGYTFRLGLQNEAADEIDRLRKALQLIAAPSKIIAKGEDMAVALQVLLSSHRQTALDALGEKD